MDHRDDLGVVDADFVHLFSSWFKPRLLVLRRIDWSTPASILEKIIRYEAVHLSATGTICAAASIRPDRRCYAFFHPALVDEPLIFVEVALTREIPAAIEPILAAKRDAVDPAKATTATFYSISNCQRGLAGVSFGNFLIKQVVEEISRELPGLSTFVTLSPVPNFAEWLRRERLADASVALRAEDKAALAVLDREDWWQHPTLVEKVRDPLTRAAAFYFLHARTRRGLPLDSVARFHLGNGARLERINFLADTSLKALRQAHGLMVNYQYDLDDIEKEPRSLCEGPHRGRLERRQPPCAHGAARARAGRGSKDHASRRPVRWRRG
jgi:malonyl-CoA decarboxylase